jgi:nicotinamide riboside transporter PnuC
VAVANKQRLKKHVIHHVSQKLWRSLLVSIVISVLLLAVAAYETLRDRANPFSVGLGLMVGVVAGALLSRAYKISWDPKEQRIRYAIDALGVVLLAASIGLDISRNHLVGLFVHGPSITATGMALLSGTLYGRFIGNTHAIVQVLRQQKIVPPKH